MLACVTSGLTTPGVRTRSAWYGDFCEAPCGATSASPSKSRPAAARAVRGDMRRNVLENSRHRKMAEEDTAQPKLRVRSPRAELRSEGCRCRARDCTAGGSVGNRCLVASHGGALRPDLRSSSRARPRPVQVGQLAG